MSEIIPPAPSTPEDYRPLEVVYVPRPKDRYWLHILLLLATIFTTLVVGAHLQYNFQHDLPAFQAGDEVVPFFPVHWALQPGNLQLGISFCGVLLLVLLAHEMGHYLCCRYYGVNATLPFFIPAPTLIGTLGAVIRIRSPIRSRIALFDIGIAGPIAGFLVATSVLVIAMPLSKLMPQSADNSDVLMGYPLIFRMVWYVLPLAGIKAHSSALHSIYFHPTVIAAWIGMFATSLNLLPGGQLDGGHIVFSIAPRMHKIVSRLTILALIPMAFFFWEGWLVWAILLWISGMRHPTVVEWPGITGFRRWVAGFALVMLVLTFAPTPFRIQGQPASFLGVLRAWRGGQ